MTARRLARPLVALVSVLLVASCGGGDPVATDSSTFPPAGSTTTADGGATTSSSADPSTSTTAEAAAFPVTIDHKFGSTEITHRPERIVVVGLTEQDALLALGVAPVGVTEWFGEFDHATWPWAQPLLGDAEPTVLTNIDGLQLERIAALDPDVIIGLYSGLTREEYADLTAIAPTVAQPGEYVDWGIPWQEATIKVGQIVGEAAEAERLVADVEDRIAQVREEHPEFAGASAAVATPHDGSIWVYGPEDVRGRFLSSLGMEMPEPLVAASKEEYGGTISLEQTDLLDLDLVIWLDTAGLRDFAGPVYPALPVHTEGREVHLDSYAADGLGGATSFVTVVSLPYLLDRLVPMMATAIDGDPATVVAAPAD